MNRNKQCIYNFKENAPKAKTIDLWLNKYKPRETTMIETYKKCFDVVDKPKRRHHRSVTIRNIRKIYGFTVENLAWEVRLCEYNNWSHGVAVEQSRKRRLYVYYY